MKRKVFRSGNSLVVALPKDALEALGITIGSEVAIALDKSARQLTVQPLRVEPGVGSIDAEFAHEIAGFIAEYRPALAALAE